jgi:hypothetical protein
MGGCGARGTPFRRTGRAIGATDSAPNRCTRQYAGRPASKESRGPIGRRDRPRTSSPGERSRSALPGMESLIQLPDRRGRGSPTETRRDRPGRREALAACRADDSLVVTKLERREVRLSARSGAALHRGRPQKRQNPRWCEGSGEEPTAGLEPATPSLRGQTRGPTEAEQACRRRSGATRDARSGPRRTIVLPPERPQFVR